MSFSETTRAARNDVNQKTSKNAGMAGKSVTDLSEGPTYLANHEGPRTSRAAAHRRNGLVAASCSSVVSPMCPGKSLVSGGSASTQRSERLIFSASQPGKSVRPMEPLKTRSPQKSSCCSRRWKQTCPGVCRAVRHI